MLQVGSKAPEFVLKNDSGRDMSLTELLDDGPLVLYFYPADFTPGCTIEACAIRDRCRQDGHQNVRCRRSVRCWR